MWPCLLSPVQPNPPEKLTVVMMEDNSYPFLRASWEPPHKADTRSGWITLIYEIRVKLEGRNDWEVRTCFFGLSVLNLLIDSSREKVLLTGRNLEWNPPPIGDSAVSALWYREIAKGGGIE